MTTPPDQLFGIAYPDANGHADARLGNGHRTFRSTAQTETDGQTSRIAAMTEEINDLRACLDTLPIIEQSKGILMLRFQIDAETAFNLLRRWSSHHNIKLRHISRRIVEAATHDARSHVFEKSPGPGLSLADVLIWLDRGPADGAGSTPADKPHG